MQENKNTLIGVAEIIKRSWNLYAKNFKNFFMVMLWLLLPAVLTSLLLIKSLGAWADILYSVVVILIFILSIWINIVLIKLTYSLYRGESYNLCNIYHESWSKFWSYIALTAILFWIIAGGLLLFIIPGIILAVWYSFALFIMITNNKKGLTALLESKKMVAGKWWQVLWRWLVPSIFYGILIMVPIWVLETLIGGVALGHFDILLSGEVFWWSDLISATFSIIATPLLVALGVILYVELQKSNMPVLEQIIKKTITPLKTRRTTAKKTKTAKK